jgi:hypothetical protein
LEELASLRIPHDDDRRVLTAVNDLIIVGYALTASVSMTLRAGISENREDIYYALALLSMTSSTYTDVELGPAELGAG